MTEIADVVIIGGGTAGLTALAEVQKKTRNVLMINDGSWGTTCASVGCMPSKALIEAANAFHRRHALPAFGISGTDALRIDIPAVLERVRHLRDDFTAGPRKTPERLGDRAISGRARLLGPDRVEVGGRQIRARAIILAPGSRPIVPAPWQAFGARILTTDTLFDQTDLPRRIAVIGMGAIGVEMAQALARLGLRVAGFDAAETVAGISDPEIRATFCALLRNEIGLHLRADAELTEAGDDAILVRAGEQSFTADAVLAAIGRRPNIDGLGLDTLGVPLDDRGMPKIDPHTLRIGDLPVYLVGDANGNRALLHEAADEGHIAGRNAVADTPRAMCRRTPMGVVFSTPQVARIGKGFDQIAPDRRAVGTADFTRQARARTAETAAGLMHVYADRTTGALLGAEMCTPAAEHMAHLLALAIERGLSVADMLAMPFYHPVLEEGLRGALRDLARQVPGTGGSDLSDCPDTGHAALG